MTEEAMILVWLEKRSKANEEVTEGKEVAVWLGTLLLCRHSKVSIRSLLVLQ